MHIQNSADSGIQYTGPEQLIGNMVLGNLSSLAELSSEGKSGACAHASGFFSSTWFFPLLMTTPTLHRPETAYPGVKRLGVR